MTREIEIKSNAWSASVLITGDIPVGILQVLTNSVRSVGLDYMGVEVSITTTDYADEEETE